MAFPFSKEQLGPSFEICSCTIISCLSNYDIILSSTISAINMVAYFADQWLYLIRNSLQYNHLNPDED